ncbi:hypothetical protein E2C01_021956 [Portunus trituberculatus]|uniref:Uncharacterized protein n=1 Tax=Portunus trituberculatus TaxID=210409 RepID=A0A5B7E5Z5_PORTR|nr:hypothetical protein [Portunus trituberculatus]
MVTLAARSPSVLTLVESREVARILHLSSGGRGWGQLELQAVHTQLWPEETHNIQDTVQLTECRTGMSWQPTPSPARFWRFRVRRKDCTSCCAVHLHRPIRVHVMGRIDGGGDRRYSVQC